MMKLKSFRPEVDKSWRVIDGCLKYFFRNLFFMSTIKNVIFYDSQLSLKYIHTGQTEMLCSHLGNAYSILAYIGCRDHRGIDRKVVGYATTMYLCNLCLSPLKL